MLPTPAPARIEAAGPGHPARDQREELLQEVTGTASGRIELELRERAGQDASELSPVDPRVTTDLAWREELVFG